MDWVVFDMDDVLVSSRELLLNALNEHTGEQLTIDQWHDFTLTNVYKNLNQFELVDIFHKIQFIENGVLEAYAAETVKHIAEQGFNVGILTARGWHQRGEELTWDFVKKHQMPVKKIHAVQLGEKKEDVILQQFPGKIHAYCDDNAKHVYGIRHLGINAILQDRPWNRHALDLPRIFHLQEFVEKHVPLIERPVNLHL